MSIEPTNVKPVPTPQRGQPLTAEFLESVVARIERLEQTVRDPVAAVFAAMPSQELVQCRIVKRRFDGDPLADTAEPAEAPSRFTYDVRGIRRGAALRLQGLTPVYGREVRNDEALVYPARVGQVCYIVRSPADGTAGLVGELMLLPGCEVPARRRCSPGALLAGGGRPPADRRPEAKLPPPPPPSSAPGKGGGDSEAPAPTPAPGKGGGPTGE